MTLNERLLAWYRDNARVLPWRGEPRDPYRVLVSELMLQQTQVDRVRPRFEAFIAAFPDLAALAAASEEAVLAAWSGLGYYRRARMLHRLAREVAAGTGTLPGCAAELAELPGVGPYTAAAVASLAFGEAVPVLDGNVQRVAARFLAFGGDPRSADGREALLRWLRPLVEEGPPGLVNEALMELGATVCRPVSPHCGRCPLAVGCRARAEGRQERIPPPRRRRSEQVLSWAAACCVDAEGRWLVRQVCEGPILRGLWLPPIAELEPREAPEAGRPPAGAGGAARTTPRGCPRCATRSPTAGSPSTRSAWTWKPALRRPPPAAGSTLRRPPRRPRLFSPSCFESVFCRRDPRVNDHSFVVLYWRP